MNPLFDDFREIRAYVLKYPGAVVLSSDDPLRRQIGWEVLLPKPWWLRFLGFFWKGVYAKLWKPRLVKRRGLTKVKDCLQGMDPKFAELFRTAVGRERIAEQLSKGYFPHAP